MKGQWIGRYISSDPGGIVVNIDEMSEHYEGVAYVHPSNPGLPKSQIQFRTSNKEARSKFRTSSMSALDPVTHRPVVWENIKSQFQEGAVFSDYADVEASVEDGHLNLHWRSNVGLEGKCSLQHSLGSSPSKLVATKVTWNQFKALLPQFVGDQNFIFRGQSKPWRLRTAFHRHGRADLDRFERVDMPMLHKYLSGLTRHWFNLNDPLQNAAFLSLAQHHGYPTALLDWTRSPYVAAFFAFRGLPWPLTPSADTSDEHIRIFVFNCEAWSAVRQYHVIATPMLHISIVDVLAIENPRLLPQQAVALISSVDDIETYLENFRDNAVLQAFDIPVSAREQVLSELRFMGITAGAMFPGLDGVCEELKDRNFRFR